MPKYLHVSILQSADTVKMLSATQQTQEEVARTKQQLSFEVERIKQDSDMKVSHTQIHTHIFIRLLIYLFFLSVSKQMGFGLVFAQINSELPPALKPCVGFCHCTTRLQYSAWAFS